MRRQRLLPRNRSRWVLATLALLTATAAWSQSRREPSPVRQNPNVDRPITNENFDSAVVNLLQQLVAAYGPIANGNDLPNPYVRIEPWGEPPPGNDGEWAAVNGAEGGPDGYLYVSHRCHGNSCVDRTEPPFVKLDPRTGEQLGSWGVGLMAFPHGFHVDHEGNVWSTDIGRGDAPGGHLVRKFSPEGELLMTLGTPGFPATARESSGSPPTSSSHPRTARSSSPRATSRTAPTPGSRSSPPTARSWKGSGARARATCR